MVGWVWVLHILGCGCIRCFGGLSPLALLNSLAELEILDNLLLMDLGIALMTLGGWFERLWTYKGLSLGFL